VLTINEIFHSIQGESTHAGRPCVFVRLTACDLRCRWCDTPYAFHEGRKMSVDEVVADDAIIVADEDEEEGDPAKGPADDVDLGVGEEEVLDDEDDDSVPFIDDEEDDDLDDELDIAKDDED